MKKFLLRRLWQIYHGAAFEWNEDKAPRMAAALAFYTVFSLAPIVIIAVTVAGIVFGREAALSEVYNQAQLLIGKDGVAAIRLLVEHAPDRPKSTMATIVGLATMFFAAVCAMTSLMYPVLGTEHPASHGAGGATATATPAANTF